MELIKYKASGKSTGFRNFTDRFFLSDRFFNDEFEGGSLPDFSPKVDIAEYDEAFEIQLHVPGMKKSDFNIDLNDDHISIHGERKFENEKKEKNSHSIESHYGTFHRTFYLPDIISREKVDATYHDGILAITLPKDERKVIKKQQVTVK